MIGTLKCVISLFISSIQFSRSVMSDSLWPHELQHTRLPCPSPITRAYSNSCPLHRWCHPTISSSVILFLLPSIFPSIRLFSNESVLCIRRPNYWRFSFSISPSNENSGWFPLGLTSWITFLSKGLLSVLSLMTVQRHQFLSAQPFLLFQLSHPYMTMGNTIALTMRTFVVYVSVF